MQVMFYEASTEAMMKLKKFGLNNDILVVSHPSYKEVTTGLFDVSFSVPETKILFLASKKERFGLYVEGNENRYVVIPRNTFRKVDMW